MNEITSPTGERFVAGYLAELQKALGAIDPDQIDHIAKILWRCFKSKRRLAICGNGGSAATASHLVADFAKGLGAPWDVRCLSDNAALLTAYANDVCYTAVYSKQVQSFLTEYDTLMIFSGSGNSANVVHALRSAKAIGAATVVITGMGGGVIGREADHALIVPSHDMQIVEDCHLAIGHIIFRSIQGRLAY